MQRLIGVQAQVMSAAELSLGARVAGLKREQVQAPLWQDRTLLKTWTMRGTIHVFAAAELPLVVAVRTAGAMGSDTSAAWDLLRGSTTRLCAVRDVLGAEPMPREIPASRVAEQMQTPEMRRALLESS